MWVYCGFIQEENELHKKVTDLFNPLKKKAHKAAA